MKKEYEYVSCCGRYYCASCAYFRGTMVDVAKNLLGYAERYGSLRLIAERSRPCNFDEFLKGLRWLASQSKPCRGCRFGGGWSWWPDCPVRDCTIQKGIDFCYECNDFPCKELKEEPLLDRKKMIIETNNRIKTLGIERHVEQLKERYRQADAAQALREKSTPIKS